MRALSDADFLNLWERGFRRHPLDQALLLLGAALPGTPRESLADWPLGRRNRTLFELHCKAFGSRLQGWTSCAGCGEKVEFDLDANVLMSAQGEKQGGQEALTVGSERFRLPTSRDLAEAGGRAQAAMLRIKCRSELGGKNRLTYPCRVGTARAILPMRIDEPCGFAHPQ